MSQSVTKRSYRDASASKNQLQLYNLRPLTHQNTLLEAEKDQIWIPSVTFTNTATQVVISVKQSQVRTMLMQERSLRDNSSLVTVARKEHL